jgi:type IV pilus assembly protein PilC
VTLGRRLSDELEKSEQFPIMVVRMISIAEDVGTLPAVLREISSSYIEEVEYAIRRIMTVIEPIMILCVGGIVGFVLVALYYPIFNLGNVFLEGA